MRGFAQAVPYVVGTNPDAVATGDLNGDGKIDAVVANKGSHSFSLLLGDGTGALGLPLTLSTGANTTPISIKVATLAGDAFPDVVVLSNTASHERVVVFLGKGDGTFKAPAAYAISANPVGLVIADYDANGRPDIMIVSGVNPEFLSGTATGSFAPASYFAPLATVLVGMVDVNGDGVVDRLTQSFNDPKPLAQVDVALGDGSGGYSQTSTPGDGIQIAGVGVGDVDHDHHADILAIDLANQLTVYRGNGDGTFTTGGTFATRFLSPVVEYVELQVVDLDGDGNNDVIYGDQLLYGDGGGSFGVAVRLDMSQEAVADLDHDGYNDIVATWLGSFGVRRNIPITLPDPPLAVTAFFGPPPFGHSGTTLSCDFTAPANTGGAPITDVLFVATTPGGPNFTALDRSTIVDIPTGKPYSITLAYENAFGAWSPPSTPIVAVSDDPTRPKSVTVSWTAAEAARIQQIAAYLGDTPENAQKTAVYLMSFLLSLSPSAPDPQTLPPPGTAQSYTSVWDPSEFAVLQYTQLKFLLDDVDATRYSMGLLSFLLGLGGH